MTERIPAALEEKVRKRLSFYQDIGIESCRDTLGHDSDGRALRGAGFGAKPDDFIENALRDFGFAHAGERKIAAIRCEERDDVGVVVETGAFRGDIVGDD